jgi:hypothetical protein
LCLATASFEDFVLELLDRCFAFIESCSSLADSNTQRVDTGDPLSAFMSTEEHCVEQAMVSIFSSVLSQSSPTILEVRGRFSVRLDVLLSSTENLKHSLNIQEDCYGLFKFPACFSFFFSCLFLFSQSALQKLKSHILGRTMETRVSGKYASAMVKGAVRVSPFI